ncbi:MAG: uL22 family ribosomal protein [Nanoarchaeota archaeon]|nr:uL22 family ribosomal protein [Nanoarchaeota archaeon]
MAEEHKITEKKEETKTEEKKTAESPKTEAKKEKIVKTKEKKNQSIVNGRDMPVSLKQAVAIAKYIRSKDIDVAINMLEEVIKMKKPVPMRGEIPHRRGMMSGRYPVKASKEILRLLKSLKSNAIQDELELEKFKLHAIPNLAPRPYKRFGSGRFKRCHITIKLIPRNK